MSRPLAPLAVRAFATRALATRALDGAVVLAVVFLFV
jgi:hypothetical protein